MSLSAVVLALGAILGGSESGRKEAAAKAGQAALQDAAALYHQGRFDSARVRLEGLLAAPGWRRRDTLAMLQYLGMTEARLGADSAAVARFADLLAADSLFRFPRNEDAAVLAAFQAARDRRSAPSDPASGHTGPSVDPAPVAVQPEAPAEVSLSIPAAPVSAASAAASPRDPLKVLAAEPPAARMNLALGAMPLGAGWLARRRTAHGLALGVLQAGGLLLSLYASERQSEMQGDLHGLEGSERGGAVGWQWVQRISLSTAVGAYLFSLIASGGE